MQKGLNHTRITRRQLLRGMGVGVGLLAIGGLAQACGSEGSTPTSSVKTSSSPSQVVTPSASPATAASPTGAVPVGTQPVGYSGPNATLSMWFDTTGGAQGAKCVVDAAITPFNSMQSKVKVDPTFRANAWDATRTALAGGGGPDLVGTPGPSFAVALATANQLAPLDEYIARYGWKERYLSWALPLGLVNGKIYSLPNEMETLVLYYNKTLFQQHGWKPPRTMDDLMKLAAQIDAAGIIPFAHGNADWRPANEWFVGEFLNHVAGPDAVYQALMGQKRWDSPEFIHAIDLLVQMQKNGWFMGSLARYYTTNTNTRLAAFGDGKAAMDIEGTWVIANLKNYFGKAAHNNNEWDWVPMPSSSGKEIFDLAIGSTMSINANSKNLDAAAYFLDYFFSPEVDARVVVHCGVEPAPIKISASQLKGMDPRQIQIFEHLVQASNEGSYGYTTWTFWPPAAENWLIEKIEDVWAGKMTVKEYLEGHQKVFDQERKEGKVPPIPKR